MPSPVSIFLRDFRLRVGMTQLDLAHDMGYEQAYVSALELGIRSPSQEFLAVLVTKLEMNEQDRNELEVAIADSRRRFVLTPEASTKTFRFCNALWERLDRLHPAVVDAMHNMLIVADQVSERPVCQPTRLKRRILKRDVPM